MDIEPFYWFHAGADFWSLDSENAIQGAQSLRSGNINHNQVSEIRTIVNSVGGILSFDVNVSSEGCYDNLRLYINGTENNKWCNGSVETINIYLESGMQELKWVYSKDGSVNRNLDAAWLDNMFIPAVPDSDNDGVEDALEYEEFGHLNGN